MPKITFLPPLICHLFPYCEIKSYLKSGCWAARKFLRFLVKIEGFGDGLGPISWPAVPLVSSRLASGEKLDSGKSIRARQDLPQPSWEDANSDGCSAVVLQVGWDDIGSPSGVRYRAPCVHVYFFETTNPEHYLKSH